MRFPAFTAAMLLAAAPCASAHGSHGGHAHGKLGRPHAHAHEVTPNPLAPAAERFSLSAITLDPASELSVSQSRNAEYMLSLDNVRLACLFTSAANITGTFEHPTCVPYDHPQYFGHYLGHYLNAMAIFISSRGDTVQGTAMSTKLQGLLDILAGVQAAWGAVGEPGFLYPFSPVSFSNLEAGHNCDPVCVPYYVFHKSLAGLIDLAVRTGNAQAQTMAVGMGTWAQKRVAGVLATGGQAQWQNVLNTEWGGMNDALNNLFKLTGDETFLTTASAFNHWAWTAPLAVHDDQLQIFHANTHLPEILGDLNGYSISQNDTQRAIVDNFLDILYTNHSWATGGSNDHEWWSPPRTLGDNLNSDTEESCTQYNIVKISSLRGDLTGDASNYDWAEKQLINGLLGNQNLQGKWEGTQSQGFHYMLPLGGGGLHKPWGDSASGFPCCWGTLTEQFAGRHLELIYTHAPANDVLFVNLFFSSTLTWVAHGTTTITQVAGFPASTTSTTRLTIGGSGGTFTLALRVPAWTAGAPTITVNGARVSGAVAGTYLRIPRTWAAGDVIDAYFPAELSFEHVTDDRPQFAGWGAILYGPILLAAVNTTSDVAPDHDPSKLSAWVTRIPNETALRFTMAGPIGIQCSGAPVTSVALIPLREVMDEAYTVYWHTGPSVPGVTYNGTATSTVPSTANDWQLFGTASMGSSVIRSGNPGDVNVASLRSVIQDATHSIAGVDFTYAFNVGYGAAGSGHGSNFSVVLIDACSPDPNHPRVLSTVWSSPLLKAPAYDACSDCYSKPEHITAALPAPVSVAKPTLLAVVFDDNDRNLQLVVPLDAAVTWA